MRCQTWIQNPSVMPWLPFNCKFSNIEITTTSQTNGCWMCKVYCCIATCSERGELRRTISRPIECNMQFKNHDLTGWRILTSTKSGLVCAGDPTEPDLWPCTIKVAEISIVVTKCHSWWCTYFRWATIWINCKIRASSYNSHIIRQWSIVHKASVTPAIE
jgi:hypothetical protein